MHPPPKTVIYGAFFIVSIKIQSGLMCLFIFFASTGKKKVSHILAAQSEEVQQYVKNGSRAIRGRVFPEYVCIEDVDKIISSVQRAPEEAAGWGEPGKHLTASETRFTPIDRPTTSVINGKRPGLFIISQRRTLHAPPPHRRSPKSLCLFQRDHNVDPTIFGSSSVYSKTVLILLHF